MGILVKWVYMVLVVWARGGNLWLFLPNDGIVGLLVCGFRVDSRLGMLRFSDSEAVGAVLSGVWGRPISRSFVVTRLSLLILPVLFGHHPLVKLFSFHHRAAPLLVYCFSCHVLYACCLVSFHPLLVIFVFLSKTEKFSIINLMVNFILFFKIWISSKNEEVCSPMVCFFFFSKRNISNILFFCFIIIYQNIFYFC